MQPTPRQAEERRITALSPLAYIPPVLQRGLTSQTRVHTSSSLPLPFYPAFLLLHSQRPGRHRLPALRVLTVPARGTGAGRGGEEIDGEQRGGRCRGRGVAQGRRAEGHGGSPGPACQGGRQPDAPEVPARARPRRGQGLGDAAQVRGVEAGGRAGGRRRRHAGGAGAGGAVARVGLHGRRRPRGPPRPARLPGQALLRQPGHGRLQAACCVPAGQRLREDPTGAGQVRRRRGSQGVGVRQLRRARVRGGHRDHAELLPGAAGQGAHGPRALPVYEGLEDGVPLHRRQH
ncbi:hypothetical protein ACQJBY_024828 [Aegilops geniculata]